MHNTIEELLTLLSETKDVTEQTRIYLRLTEEYRNNGQYEESKVTAQKAIDLATSNNSFLQISKAFNALGISCSVQGYYFPAEEYFLKSLEIARKIDNPLQLSGTLINLGTVEGFLGNFNKALEYMFEAIELTRESDDLSRLGTLYGNIGVIYRRMGDLTKALEFAKRSLRIRAGYNNPNDTAISIVNIGNIYQLKNDYGLAIGYYKRAQKLLESCQNYLKLTTLYFNIGEMYYSKKDLKNALHYCSKSIKTGELTNERGSLILAHKTMGNILSSLGDIKLAKEHYEKAMEICHSYDDNEIISSLYHDIADFYTKLNDMENANVYLKKIIGLNQQIFSEKMSNEVAKIQSQYDYLQKIRENELIKSKNAELTRYNELIEKQKTELQSLNASKDSILRVVSHDLKNILGGIKQIHELLLTENQDDQISNFIRLIGVSSDKGLNLVKMLLESDQIEMEGYQLKLTQTNIDQAVLESISGFTDLALTKNISIIYTNEDPSVTVDLNEEKFHQITDNLINNAIKFSHQNSEIEVSLTKEIRNNQPYSVLSIKDHGIGIHPDHIESIFKKFTPARRKGTAGENTTGLGLSIVKRMTELHKGFITVESEVGRGSIFRVFLPINITDNQVV